jgi:hypothetical protein
MAKHLYGKRRPSGPVGRRATFSGVVTAGGSSAQAVLTDRRLAGGGEP